MKEIDRNNIALNDLDEKKNKQLLLGMWALLISSLLFYFGIFFITIYFLSDNDFIVGLIISLATVVLVITAFYALKMEVEAGYYECRNCGHRYVPKYTQALFAPHMHTTRYLKCPKCGQRSWSKKVMRKND